MTTDKGPVFKAVEMIVRVTGHKNYHVFSYRHDFEELWLSGETNPRITQILKQWNKGTQEEQTVVIVWDGMPEEGDPDHINVGRFVSPHDWAMAASWIIYDKECLKELKLRILILKVDPSGTSFASDSLYAFQNALPWIQDYRVVETEDVVVLLVEDMVKDQSVFASVRQSFRPEARDLEMFVKDLLEPNRILTTHSSDDDDRERHVLYTRGLWKENLLKAGTRHSVANLIAPTVLAEGLPEKFRVDALKKISQKSLQRKALISTLSEVHILEKGTSASSTGEDYVLEKEQNGNVFGRQDNIKFVLVDDHFDLGYDHVLAYTLFGESKPTCWTGQDSKTTYSWKPSSKRTGSLTCYKNPNWLISQLEKVSISEWDQPRYLFEEEEEECDVLFLDLRLWEDGDKETRRKVIIQILFAAAKLLVNNGTKVVEKALKRASKLSGARKVSPNFVKAFQAAKEASKDPDKFSPEALTLLPLLLSHIDRTLPIVLFTSSHQRVVSDMLRDHRNIITAFVKPLISGYGEEISPADSMKDLRNATRKAIELHEARIAWKRICELKPENATYRIITDTTFEPTKDFIISTNATPEQETGNVEFKRDKVRLIKRLAELFEACVFDNSVYESISQPWEFLECEIARWGPSRYEAIRTSVGRGKVANALKETRNLKTHGELERYEFAGVKSRWVAVLQLLFLLDFLKGRDYGRDEPKYRVCYVHPSDKTPKRVMWKLVNNVRNCSSRNFLHEHTKEAMLELMELYNLVYTEV